MADTTPRWATGTDILAAPQSLLLDGPARGGGCRGARCTWTTRLRAWRPCGGSRAPARASRRASAQAVDAAQAQGILVAPRRLRLRAGRRRGRPLPARGAHPGGAHCAGGVPRGRRAGAARRARGPAAQGADGAGAVHARLQPHGRAPWRTPSAPRSTPCSPTAAAAKPAPASACASHEPGCLKRCVAPLEMNKVPRLYSVQRFGPSIRERPRFLPGRCLFRGSAEAGSNRFLTPRSAGPRADPP